MSVAKVAASRRNSSLSTGPRTDGGKAASSRNATRHGILSAVPIVAGDRTADLEAFDAALRADLRPEGAVESLLADRAIACAWRLRRAARAERDVLERELRDESASPLGPGRRGPPRPRPRRRPRRKGNRRSRTPCPLRNVARALDVPRDARARAPEGRAPRGVPLTADNDRRTRRDGHTGRLARRVAGATA